MAIMFPAICFFVLLGSALAEEPLDVLVKAASSFSAAIVQQVKCLNAMTPDAACAPGGLQPGTGALQDQLALHLG